MNRLFLLATTLLLCNLLSGQEPLQIAATPPMGWNSWNCFRGDISEAKIKAMADALVSSGMKDAGYQYIIIDDGWASKERDADGHIIPDLKKFPKGIKAVADYVHGKGLKFGIYSSPGCFTCQKLMGSIGHEQTDATDYAAWGVDYLKYDWCNYPSKEPESLNTPIADCRAAFELMGKCLKNTGRPILYSLNDECEKGNQDRDIGWIKTVANMQRVSDDIKNNWARMLYCLDLTADLWQYAGPGYWNDPDMLEVGNETNESLWGKISPVYMNLTEYKSHFGMWCMAAAPLIAGNDLRDMSPEIRNILTNRALIAVDQDPLGKQGRRIRQTGDLEVWVKELAGNRLAVALLNRKSVAADISVKWEELGISGNRLVTDLWTNRDLGKFKKSYTGVKVKSHEARILLLSPL